MDRNLTIPSALPTTLYDEKPRFFNFFEKETKISTVAENITGFYLLSTDYKRESPAKKKKKEFTYPTKARKHGHKNVIYSPN